MEKVVSKTMEEVRANIQEFANKHKVIFEDEGECGFGRECVGLMRGEKWVDYNPTDSVKYEPIEEMNDERMYDIAPSNAYHKHDCIAVLGRGEDAIRELSDWVDGMKDLNVELKEFATGATGIQAMLSGVVGYAFVPQ